jgi:hypothetical protein
MRDDVQHCAYGAYSTALVCEFLQGCSGDIGLVPWGSRPAEGTPIRSDLPNYPVSCNRCRCPTPCLSVERIILLSQMSQLVLEALYRGVIWLPHPSCFSFGSRGTLYVGGVTSPYVPK